MKALAPTCSLGSMHSLKPGVPGERSNGVRPLDGDVFSGICAMVSGIIGIYYIDGSL
jgi:hypothetical protein